MPKQHGIQEARHRSEGWRGPGRALLVGAEIETRWEAHTHRSISSLQAAVDVIASGRMSRPASAMIPGRALTAVVLLSLALGVALSGVAADEHSSGVPAVRSGQASLNGLSSLPLAEQGTISRLLGADDSAYRVISSDDAFLAVNPAQRLRTRFSSAGALLNSGRIELGLSLRAVGYGASLRSLGNVSPHVWGHRVLYARTGLGEWYANGPLGLEQGFTIPKAPSARPAGPLTLSMALAGGAHASLASDGQSVILSHAGTSLRYGGVLASDARGRTLHGWLEVSGASMLLRVDTHGARYPLRIDPVIQQAKLTGGEESGGARFGFSVALSSDGNTALIGGQEDNGSVGAAWVFTRSGSTWTQQGPKLTGSGESGAGRFGDSVALSSDGNTALIGGPYDNKQIGAAWVFTRSGSTWTQQGPKLTGGGESGEGNFSDAVALSSDGNTAMIGAGCDGSGTGVGCVGAIWAFTRAGSTWTQQGPKLTGGGESGNGEFGIRVALSSEGNTAVIGAPYDGTAGAAWIFTRSGSTWTQQGPKFTGSEEIGESRFGFGVAVSSDGNTALIGGHGDNLEPGQHGVGAAWVFTRSGSTWTQQGPKLTGKEESGFGDFGEAVALSSGGSTALIGGSNDNKEIGAAWVFARSGSTWTQQGAKLTASGEIGTGTFGISVALSASATTALIGGAGDNRPVESGAAWVFATTLAPTVTKVEPTSGPHSGGTSVAIAGTGFTGATAVRFGSTKAVSFTVNSETSITAVSPAGTGKVDVTVTTQAGTSAHSPADRFTYGPTVTDVKPKTGPPRGGTSVTITGTGFTGATAVRFGSTNAKRFTVNSATSITAVSPKGTGSVDVTVTTPAGTSPTSQADLFTY
jgi:hypothetical protein